MIGVNPLRGSDDASRYAQWACRFFASAVPRDIHSRAIRDISLTKGKNMRPKIEAASLSGLNELADTPSATKGVSRTGREALTLYIARVPGSRDVFLSTLKPRERVVSALDIASSFYYFHFEAATGRTEQSNSAVQEHEDQVQAPTLAPGLGASSSGPKPDVNRDLSIPRKPVGPRALPIKKDILRDGFDKDSFRDEQLLSSSQDEHSIGNDNVLIIRRDSTSGSQTTVGSILLEHHLHSPRKIGTSPIDIDIFVPGYCKFDSSGSFRRIVGHNDTNVHLGAESRSLSFKSPWGDECTFNTGVSGRSLKCSYPGTNDSSSEYISELRLSLPASGIFGSQRTPSPEKQSKRASFQAALFFRHHSHSRETLKESEGMDLSLGQEAAGGGFRGKSAKLGKLIVEEKGQEMLDLVIAANVAIFLSLYDSRS